MDGEKPSEEKQRKTISLTHRQIGATGLIGLAVALAPYLKETFVTKQEGQIVSMQIEYIRKDIAEIKTSLATNTTKIIDEMKDSEKRTGKTDERLERRIDALEEVEGDADGVVGTVVAASHRGAG